jgi:hypothetical protein
MAWLGLFASNACFMAEFTLATEAARFIG